MKYIKFKLKSILMCTIIAMMVLSSINYPLALEAKNTQAQDQTANEDIVRNLKLQIKMKDEPDYKEFSDPYQIKDSSKIDKLKAEYSFELNEEEIEGQAVRTMKGGDYYLINLPSQINISNPPTGLIPINDNELQTIANYSFIKDSNNNNWQIKVEFTDFIDNVNNFQIKGHFEFEFDFNLDGIDDGETTNIFIPIDNNNNIEIDVTKPQPPETTPKTLQKKVAEYDEENRLIVWEISMSPENGIFEDCIFTDNINPEYLELASIKHGNVKLTGDEYSYNPSSGLLSYTIPKGRNGNDFTKITITTRIKDSVFNKNDVKTVTNQAFLKGGEQDVNITSNSASQKIDPNWLNKSGSVIDGNKIKWTINANNTKQKIYDVVVTDTLQKDLVLDKTSLKVDGQTINVYDNTHEPTNNKEIYAIYKADNEHNELKIFFPRTKDNAAPKSYKIELITSVIAPSDIEEIKYSNTANIEGKFIGNGPTDQTLNISINSVGVGVPNVAIIKTHKALTNEDKRNGTIEWEIKAVSNLSEYGKSVITDILPNDQEYIPDSIRLGDKKLSSYTDPAAEINGNTLTITFNKSKALSTQQTINFKTKIKTGIYGDNINRGFTNEAKVDLYDIGNQYSVTSATDNDAVKITNTVISKNATEYNGHIDKSTGDKPRVDFNITINNNLMPLQNVVVTDNLNNIKTKFIKANSSSNVENVKWTYVDKSIKITKVNGTLDNFSSEDLAKKLQYNKETNTLTLDFGQDINDSYKITFTAELDPEQNYIFKENGTIQCYGNSASIQGGNLKPGLIESNKTDDFNIKNEVLGKSGTHEVNDQQVIWTINLNQHSIALDNPTVVDVLPDGLTLDPVSIKLYENVINSNGNFVTDVEKCTPVDFEYKYEKQENSNRYVLTVQLPNNQTSYILRFATDVDNRILGQKIENEAYYSNSGDITKNNSSSIVSLSGGASGSSTKKSSITVKKFNKDNNAPVDGAVFRLDWIKNSNETVPVRELTASSKGSIIFFGLSIGEKYSITEVKSPDGYQLDSAEPIVFNVQSADKIFLENAPLSEIDEIKFYNTPIKTGTWEPSAIKKLNGKNIIHTFDFEIRDGKDELLMTGKNTNNDSNSSDIKFELASTINRNGLLEFEDGHIFKENDTVGTEYLVKELKLKINEVSNKYDNATQTNNAYEYDTTTKEITVKVFNVKGTAKLQIKLYDKDGNLISDNYGKFLINKTPTFTNTYTAKGSITLSATKKLNGHSLDNNQFSFELYEGNTLLQTKTNAAGTNNNDGSYTGNINFDKIEYNQSDVGTKTYTIKEINSNQGGYNYDNRTYTVTVQISDDDTGNLSSEITKVTTRVNDGSQTTIADKKIEFNNSYATGSTTLNLSATKELIGRTLENEQFEFVLSKVDNPSGSNPTDTKTVSNDATGKITFPTLTYNQDDRGETYYYQIVETNSGNQGYTYDASKYIVKVKVIDNNNGTIRTETSVTKDGKSIDINNISFKNVYEAKGELELTATKQLNGKALEDNAFSYELKKVGEDKPIETVKNKKDGTISFTNLKYTEKDVNKKYNYTISEVNDGIDGYTYDGSIYNVNVKISDNGNGTLNVEKTITSNNNPVNSINFVNSYEAHGSIKLTATKTLDGKTLPDNKFTYILNENDSEGKLIREVERTTNDADGNITFTTLQFDQSNINKDHYYTINEANDGINGYTYDDSVYNVYFKVDDSNNNGKLIIDPVITLNNKTVNKITFNNKYEAVGELNLSATKILEGKDLPDKQFSFELKDVTKDDEKLIETVKNDSDGNVIFETLKYDESDINQSYHYTISEVNDKIGGYTYDENIYHIYVDVIDNDNGTLTINYKITLNNQDIKDIVFTNQYEAHGSVKLTANKILQNANLTDKMFNFILTEDNNTLQTKSNNRDGLIEFDEIKYDLDDLGTHIYTIYEQTDNNKNIKYDLSKYTVTIEVSDKNNGTLDTQVTIEKDSNVVDEISFTNQYVADIIDTGDHSDISISVYSLIASSAIFAFITLRRKKFN